MAFLYRQLMPARPRLAIRRALTRAGKDRGFTNERKVLQAFAERTPDVPDWFIAIEKASRELDRRGVDFVIFTADVGQLYLQIKSSERNKRRFETAHRHQNIAVVILHVYEFEEEVRGKIIAALSELRKRFLGIEE